MIAEIINIYPTSLEEFYIKKNDPEENVYLCHSDIWYDITASLNNIRSFIVTIHYTIKDINGEIMSMLKTRTDFKLSHIGTNCESLETLEQCTYIAYSEMLNHHKSKYRLWPRVINEPAIPDEDSVQSDINKILINLPC